MASIDDVWKQLDMLLDATVRTGYNDNIPGMGQSWGFPGLVPSTLRATMQVRDLVLETRTIGKETATLLNAVNVETLGRIETEIVAAGRADAVNELTLARIETEIKDVQQSVPSLRQDMTNLLDRLETLDQDLRERFLELHAKLDSLKNDIKSLPQNP
jgi:chromosome segregation ATPase